MKNPRTIGTSLLVTCSVLILTAQVVHAGEIYAWGRNHYGQLNKPGGTDYVAISAGNSHGLALKDDGSVVGWGSTQFGQGVSPAGSSYVAVEGGAGHSLALRSDGSINAWGYDLYHQCRDLPARNDYVAMSGQNNTLVVLADGSGLGVGTLNTYGNNNIPAGYDYRAIEAGSAHTIALMDDGTINDWGGMGYGETDNTPTGNDFIAVSAGDHHSLALRADGTLASWGLNNHGQCSNTPVFVPGVDDHDLRFVSISAGAQWSMALRANGTAVAWGRNAYGERDMAGVPNNVIATIEAADGWGAAMRRSTTDGAEDMRDDFDAGIDDSQWFRILGGQQESGAGFLDGNALWFNGTAERSATTVKMDTRNGGTISFDFRVGNQAVDGTEFWADSQGDPIDGYGDNVVLEYAANEGDVFRELLVFSTSDELGRP